MTFKNTDKKKTLLSLLFGSMMLIGSIILLVCGYIWIAPIGFTLGLAAIFKGWQFRKMRYGDREIQTDLPPRQSDDSNLIFPVLSFWNLPLSRIVVIVVIGILAIIDAKLFRTPIIDRYNPIGSWLVLMGPTLFYPLVFLPLLLTIGMGIYLIFTVRKITLQRKGDELFIRERGLIKAETIISFPEVISAHFRSNAPGLKALWILPFGIQIWGNFAAGWHYIANEFTFGTGLYIGPIFLIHSFIYLILLGVLLFTPEYEFGWETLTRECYLRSFSPSFLNQYFKDSKEKLGSFLSLDPSIELQISRSPGEKEKWKYYMYCGIGLLFLPIVSIAIPFFFSDTSRMFILMGAIASFGMAWNDYALHSPKTNFFGDVILEIHAKNVNTKESKQRRSLYKIILGISELAQIFSVGLILTTKWRLYPLVISQSPVVWVELISSSVFGLFLLFFYLKWKWDLIEEKNSLAQILGGISLAAGIALSFLL